MTLRPQLLRAQNQFPIQISCQGHHFSEPPPTLGNIYVVFIAVNSAPLWSSSHILWVLIIIFFDFVNCLDLFVHMSTKIGLFVRCHSKHHILKHHQHQVRAPHHYLHQHPRYLISGLMPTEVRSLGIWSSDRALPPVVRSSWSSSSSSSSSSPSIIDHHHHFFRLSKPSACLFSQARRICLIILKTRKLAPNNI